MDGALSIVQTVKTAKPDWPDQVRITWPAIHKTASLRRYYPVQVVRVSIWIHMKDHHKCSLSLWAPLAKYLLFVQTILVLTIFVNGLFLKSLYLANLIKRKIPEYCLAKDLILCDIGMDPIPGIIGIVAVITHDKIGIGRNIVGSEVDGVWNFFGKGIIKRLLGIIDIYV